MDVLIACEESQIVCEAFISRGHNAVSCDILPGNKGLPHYEGDISEIIYQRFDLVIFHPPCTYLANSGVRWLKTSPGRFEKMLDGMSFFNLRSRFNSSRVATENPIPHKHVVNGFPGHKGIERPDQYIQPWQFGHKQMKATGLWLKNLPLLVPTDIVGPPPDAYPEKYDWQDCWMEPKGPNRQRNRSRTFQGIAEAMADQWGTLPII